MDFQTPIICVGVVAVTSAAVYLSSVFGIRERSYEEAMEEQRRKSDLELSGLKPNKSEKPKKDKKDKKKEKTIKKEKLKDKSNNGLKTQNSEQKTQNSEQKTIPKDNSSKESVVNRKTEHAVGFKAEPEIVEEPESVEFVSHRSTSYDKPIKPILMNKNEQNSEQKQFLRHSVNGSGQRNSFDQILPKDEFELLKESKRLLELEVTQQNVVQQNVYKTPDNESTITSCVMPTDLSVVPETHTTEPEVIRTESVDNSSPARKSRKWKQSEANSKEVSVKTILDLVKIVTLTNEEIQLLTDTLLNKQSDGSTEWRKKNDPLAVLKKQLQEKEVALEKAMKNLSTAVQKTRELRNELDVEKSHQLREKNQQMYVEIQTLTSRLQQSYESQRSELSAMQKQMQQNQVKYNEERNLSLRLQDDNSRLQQIVKNEQHLKHELDQLRGDRQNFELRMAANQKTSEELMRKTRDFENRIKSMTDLRQKEESNYQKHVNDMKQELQKCETQRNALIEELSHTSNKCNSFESESIQLRNRLSDLDDTKNEEVRRLREQLSEVSKEKQILEKALTEAKHENQNGDQTSDRQELIELKEVLKTTKEELKNIKKSLENKVKSLEEIKKEIQIKDDLIQKFEKENNDCIKNAVKVSEEANNQLKTETETLRHQNESLNSKLIETLDSNDQRIQELKALKSELRSVIPSLDTNSCDWISKIQITFNDMLSQSLIQSSGDERRVKELETLLRNEREKSKEFESKATQFASTLSQTETILSELQKKIESEENNRKLKEQEFENELKSRLSENNKLRDEIKTLESSSVQIQEFKETIAEMEHKLKELQSKLSGEENEKRLLKQKYVEVSKREQATNNISNLTQDLEEKSKEMVVFESEKTEMERLKAECEELKASLEVEKKSSKNLNLQNIRLNSLVKIGHESLKIEEDRVRQLEAQLNGSMSSPIASSPTNGSNECMQTNANNICNSEEFSTVLPNNTNNKLLKPNRRVVLDKK